MAVQFKLPDIGEGIAEGEIVRWLANVGDCVSEDQPLVEIMTDKVTAEIPSPCAGLITERFGGEGDIVKVGAVILVIDDAQASDGGACAIAAAPPPIAPLPPASSALAAPATRKRARELGVDLARVTGTGPHGRITPQDVERVARRDAEETGAEFKAADRPASAFPEPEKRTPFIGVRRRIAEHLTQAKRTAPHFAYVEETDMTALVAMRRQLKGEADARHVKLTYLPFIIKAVIAGLKAFPILNSALEEPSGEDGRVELVTKYYYHIGVATATEQGLMVPVVKHADRRDVFQLAEAIQDLSNRAKTGRLKPEEAGGGTFTITSIGSIGGLFGIPIINAPEVGILGVNKIAPRPVVRDGAIVIREMMHLSMCGDHRVVDGAEAAQFMKIVIESLENPARLLL
ncbi:MAG: 2-oxo acid dehydrogenase subunit E2 [Vampirovibrionales bacterium]|nr:2-oxo acid dehydrogenase subunit E2 [Vampirovibrionales bacterium]